jgi:DNA helicase HerA-like ATPase
MKLSKGGNVVTLAEEELENKKKLEDKVLEAIERYFEKSIGPNELEDLIRYSSLDVLKSVGEKLENIESCGIFKPVKPPFDEKAVIHRHHIKSLLSDEQKMFVLFSLERLFEDSVARGVSDHIRDIIIIDEAAKFFDDNDNNILNVIAREARKFGVALICASQAPSHFSDDFISSVGTKIVLGIDEMYWDSSTRKLRIEIEKMKYVQPRKKMLVQMKQNGATQNSWQGVALTC